MSISKDKLWFSGEIILDKRLKVRKLCLSTLSQSWKSVKEDFYGTKNGIIYIMQLKKCNSRPYLSPCEEMLSADNCISVNNVTFDPVTGSHTQQECIDKNARRLLWGNTTPEFFKWKIINPGTHLIASEYALRISEFKLGLSSLWDFPLPTVRNTVFFQHFSSPNFSGWWLPLMYPFLRLPQAGPSFTLTANWVQAWIPTPFALLCLWLVLNDDLRITDNETSFECDHFE